MSIHIKDYYFPYHIESDMVEQAMNQGGDSCFEQDMNTLRYLRQWALRVYGSPAEIDQIDKSSTFIYRKQISNRLIEDAFDAMESFLQERQPYSERQFFIR
jgi:hypothetical protein